MKSKIYKKLTLENKILLSETALNYLAKQNNIDLEHIIKEYKKLNSTLLTEEIIKEILLTKEDKNISEDFYKIKNINYKLKNYLEIYENLKNKTNHKIEQIQQIKENHLCNIFGVFYSNFLNEYILEDSYSEIKLNIKNCKSKIFLFDKMVVGCRGKLVKKEFVVDDFFLPNFKTWSTKNELLKEKSFVFLVFYDVNFSEKTNLKLQKIFLSHKPSLVILLGNYENNEFCKNFIKENSQVLFFFVHARDDLPRKFQPITNDHNYKIISNPGELIFRNFKVGFIVSELFKNKTKGSFLYKNYQESFIASFLSQHSFDPFSSLDFSIDNFPNLFFVGQNAFSGVISYEDVNFVSVSSFSETFSYFKCDSSFNISLCEVDDE